MTCRKDDPLLVPIPLSPIGLSGRKKALGAEKKSFPVPDLAREMLIDSFVALFLNLKWKEIQQGALIFRG